MNKSTEIFEGEVEFFETVATSEVVPHKSTDKASRMYRSEKPRARRKLLAEKQGRLYDKGFKGNAK